MSIEINKAVCAGCGCCAEICPGSLIRVDSENKAEIPRPERCWGCVSCVKECPVQAIEFYLGEDIGGIGAKMTVRRESSRLYWNIKKPDGSRQIITVDSRDPDRY